MPDEEIVSPGVFTEERDQTFLPQGVSQISGVFIGPTERGPAFEPTLVESQSEYERIFGEGSFYTDFAVKNYLTDAGSAYVVRLLGEEGYTDEAVELIYDADKGDTPSGVTEDFLLATFAPTQNTGGKILEAEIDPDDEGYDNVDNFKIEFRIDTNDDGSVEETVSYVLSLNPSDNNYLADVLGTEPSSVREAHVKVNYPELHQEIISEESNGFNQKVSLTFSNNGGVPSENLIDFEDQPYSTAETPWVQSQDLMQNQPNIEDRRNLFKFITLSHGNDVNRTFKVGIKNIRLAGNVPGTEYGQFDVVVRDIDDTDRRPQILESFSGVNLDPQSPRYIARVIGDRYTVFGEDGKVRKKGDWPSNSDYIRVEMNPEVVEANRNGKDDLNLLVPWGFGKYQLPHEVTEAPYYGLQRKLTQGTVNDSSTFPIIDSGNPEAPFDNRTYLGFDFDSESNENFLSSVGNQDQLDSSLETKLDSFTFDFTIDDAYPNAFGPYQEDAQGNRISGTEVSERRFLMGFQGGFDGKNPATPVLQGEDITAANTQGYDCSGPQSPGTQAYEKAINIMSNDDQFDINLLSTPGIIKSLHSNVVQTGIRMVENRKDAFYIFDCVGPTAGVSQAVSSINNIDSNYAGTYYPWVRTVDNTTNRLRELPPSALMPRVYAFNDTIAAEWFAPAGLNRGGIPEAREAVTNLTKAERDELYQGRVNPIASFPDEGVVTWGQKTTQARPSALDRINVRRLLIRVKKFIASTSRYLVFEQNTAQTRLQFKNIVNPFLDQVQQRQGIFAFEVVMNEENNPPEIIDENKLVGEIFLQPARTAEKILVDFNVLPTGAEFGG